MADIELDYEYLMQNALRQVVRDVLAITAELGSAPGEHHFYIEFETGAEGVVIPEHLRETYPARMTIVLQHQFDNLSVDEDAFFVTLWFKGKEANLRIPFAAVTSFADPSVKFGLHFTDGEESAPACAENAVEEEPAHEPAPAPETPKDEESDEGPSADVVSLDSFRKK
ncbi:MAG: SspB family protein [Parvularculaceae bacterium]